MWWWHRWRARSRLGTDVGLWYHRDYAAPDIPADRRIAHMQSDRAEQALARLARLELIRAADVVAPPLARLDDLELVHSRQYLDQVSDPEVLGRIFGIPTAAVEVDALLTAQRRAVGGTIAAALAAARRGVRVGFNLGGGFHHAAPHRGAGFCVFNDVAIAVARLRSCGFEAPIAVVDLDFHQGDGNISAFAEDPSVLVFSAHGAEWTDRESASCRNFTLPPGVGDREYIGFLDDHLRPALIRHGTKLVFYIAGADVLAGDQLGDFALTPAGVLIRDRRVVAAAEMLDAPVVVTLAGGYSPGAWQCTANFIRWLLTGVRRVDRSPSEKLRYRFEEVARSLDPWELQRDEDDLELTERDLIPERERPPRRLFLDFYSAHGIELVLERYGLLAKVRERGFSDLRLTVNADDTAAQVVRLEGVAAVAAGPPLLLFELVLGRRTITTPAVLAGSALCVLNIEWLLLQDPTTAFSPTRPRLPGQEHPGLGLAKEVQQLLVQMARRLRLEGIVHRPAHYHNAVVAGRDYHFLDPEAEGRMRALRRLLANVTLPAATHLVARGRVALGDGTPLSWEPSDLVLPAGERLSEHLGSEAYGRRAMAEVDRLFAAGLHVVEG